MFRWLRFVVGLSRAILKSRRNLLFENIALRHQLLILSRTTKPTRFILFDRAHWVWLSLTWKRWTSVLRLVQPDTVVRWHRLSFRLFWRWRSRAGKPGRRRIALETADLIRQMPQANSSWGAPRIHGELLKLGIRVAQQLREAFPFTSPPKYLLWDRDSIYGLEFQQVVQALELEEKDEL